MGGTVRRVWVAPSDRWHRPTGAQRSLPYTPDGEKTLERRDFSEWGLGLLQHEAVGSQGIHKRLFRGFSQDGSELFAPIGKPDWGYLASNMFGVGDAVTRQVTRRNSPSAINSVFHDRQFHDARAESTFNGFSIFGDFDKRMILKKAMLDSDGKLLSYHPVSVALVNASLASQAVGPVVNDVEMSFAGRTFHDIATRLLYTQPLASQITDTSDSLLRRYVRQEIIQKPDEAACCTTLAGLYDPSRPGSKLTYRDWIKKAFRKEWWENSKPLSQNQALVDRLEYSEKHFVEVLSTYTLQPELLKDISSILANQELRYPAERVLMTLDAKLHGYTLVRNAFADAFKERMIANGVPHGVGVNDAVRPLLGNRRFYFDQERIPDIEALVGPLLIELMGIPDKRPTSFFPALVFPGAGKPDRKPMITWTGTRPPLEFEPSPKPGEDPVDPNAFYDQGYYNLGISEPRYDWGVWAYSGSEDSISIAQVQRLLIETPLADLQAQPYMHNGRHVSLRQVIEFYSFDNPDLIPADPVSNPDLHPEMGRLPLNHDGQIDQGDGKANLVQIQDAESLLFFLLCLTDQRVEYEKAPFDHPSITLVNGFSNSSIHSENAIEIAPVGANGYKDPPSQFPSSN